MVSMLPCCNQWMADKTFYLPVSSVDDVKAAWSGAYMADLRRSVLDGDYVHCDWEACPYLSANTFEHLNDGKLSDNGSLAAGVVPTVSELPTDIIFSADRTCNLYCGTCRTGPTVQENTSVASTIFTGLIEGGAERLHILGSGEVFASRITLGFLRTATAESAPNLRDLTLLTNGILLSPRMWGSLSPYATSMVTTIMVSVDACTAETYSLVRRGGDFKLLSRNLEFISGLRSQGCIRHFTLNMVVQDSNLHEVIGFCLWAAELGATSLRIDAVADWGHLGSAAYHEIAVHLEGHPRHSEFLQVMHDAAELISGLGIQSISNLLPHIDRNVVPEQLL